MAHAAQIAALETELARCTAQLLRAQMARRTRPQAVARADRALVAEPSFDAPGEGARGKVRYARKRRDTASRAEASARDAERLLDLLEVDNNISERELRGPVVGRHNYKFAGSPEAAERATLCYTLAASWRLHGIDPFACFLDVLLRVATHPVERLIELSPRYWQPLGAA